MLPLGYPSLNLAGGGNRWMRSLRGGPETAGPAVLEPLARALTASIETIGGASIHEHQNHVAHQPHCGHLLMGASPGGTLFCCAAKSRQHPAEGEEAHVGKTSRDYDGLKVIWNFFKSCPPRIINGL